VTRIAKTMVSVVGRKSAARFDAVTQSVAASQLRKLEHILERNVGTEYGKEHGFSSIHSLSDYARAVPVIKYESIAERVDRMAAGETNVLTAEAPIMFARTSGTTGKPKLIPVTPTCRGRDHADQMRTWLFHAQKAHPGMFSGKVLSLVSPAEEGRTTAGIPYGSTSGDIYRNIPALVRATYVIPYPVFEIEDHDAEFYAILRLGIASDVSFLCTANPSSITKLCEFADAHADDLIRDIRDGTLKQDLAMSSEQRALVEGLCKAHAELARRLDEMRSRRDGRLLPGDYWPNLDLIGCWKGGTVGAHVDGFGGWFDPDGTAPKSVRDWGYLSSEARGSIPLTDEGAGGVLTVGTNVYEFVDVDQLDAEPENPDAWTFLGAHEVDSPRDYYVFLTTTGGLYRYDINDIVRVEGFYNEAPILTFQRKGRGMTSLTGEKVSDTQVIEAVNSAASEAGVGLAHFRALADVEAARYVFQVEPEGQLSESQGRSLLEAIESKLVSLNIEYEGKRKSQRLAGPELQVMKPGWYDRGKEDQGQRLFQSKTVVLKPKEEKEHSIRSQEMCVSRIELEPRAKG
jgi:GH3 auxin-responsive promoter